MRNGGGVHLHSGGSSQAPAASSCHSTPRKGKPPTRQPLNGHGKEGGRLTLLLFSLTLWFKRCFLVRIVTNEQSDVASTCDDLFSDDEDAKR